LGRIRRRPASPRHWRPSRCRSCLQESLARFVAGLFGFALRLVAGLRQRQTWDQDEQCRCKNCGVHWRLQELWRSPRLDTKNTGPGALDPTFIASVGGKAPLLRPQWLSPATTSETQRQPYQALKAHKFDSDAHEASGRVPIWRFWIVGLRQFG
jgi:hypothetical protein